MIPIDNIFFGIPCATRNIDVDTIISTNRQIRKYGGMFDAPLAISDVALARDMVVQRFKKSHLEWLMMIDSDMIFTDYDFEMLWEGDEPIVIGPYARKIIGEAPHDFGLGFTRVHRSVFDKIDELQTETGAPVVQEFYLKYGNQKLSEIYSHYFPNGVSGDSRYLSEDRAFFVLCAMTGLSYRIEKRCRLGHVGTFVYGYPDQSSGAKFWKPSAEFECAPHGVVDCQECKEHPLTIM